MPALRHYNCFRRASRKLRTAGPNVGTRRETQRAPRVVVVGSRPGALPAAARETAPVLAACSRGHAEPPPPKPVAQSGVARMRALPVPRWREGSKGSADAGCCCCCLDSQKLRTSSSRGTRLTPLPPLPARSLSMRRGAAGAPPPDSRSGATCWQALLRLVHSPPTFLGI